MRFNTPEEVVAWADRAAAEDMQRHLGHGVSLNPYCTWQNRNDWERGWYNRAAYSWELPYREFDTVFQRGAAARRLHDRMTNATQRGLATEGAEPVHR